MDRLSKALARRLRAGNETPEAPVEGAVAPGPAAEAPPSGGQFSALDLRDRVVIMLLFDQIVSEERVAEAWALWQQEFKGDPRKPLWRLLTLVPELDRELIFAEAARVYGIEEARIVRLGALHVIEKLHRLVPRRQWEQMIKLRMVPIAEAEQNHSHRMRLIFATHDPTHLEVQALMPQLNLAGYELRYAPELEVVDLLAEAFPWKYKALKEALEAERALIAQTTTAPLEEAADLAPEAADAPAEALEDELLKTALNSSSIINFFEELLVQTVRQEAQGVCIVPNEEGQAEIYFQHDEELEQWRVIEDIHPSALLATIKSAIIRADFAIREETQKQSIKRWIDGQLVRFRVSALPSSEKLNLESIVIRVLK